MRQISMIEALLKTYQADKISPQKRHSIQQKRLQTLLTYVRSQSPYLKKNTERFLQMLLFLPIRSPPSRSLWKTLISI